MKLRYKLLGSYIREIDNRNVSGKEENLLGVSTNKIFIPSVANTVGTDFCGYKVVTRNQFTYVPDTSRRGDRIGIALLEDYDEAIVSSAYSVFEIIDHSQLLPQYLMMWFRRPEFDRYARFMSHGSVREIFGWEEMCKVELPVPDINKQKEIVEEYHAIISRIKLNKKLIQKLEETAQAIYKQWFVDFEFPDENGNPYKLSGGEMEFNEELEKEIPRGWDAKRVSDLTSCILGGTPSRDVEEYWGGEINWINSGEVNQVRITKPSEKITESGLRESATKLMPVKTTVLAITGATLGQVSVLEIDACANQSVIGLIENELFPYELIFPTITERIRELLRNQTGGAQPHINKNDVESLKVVFPTNYPKVIEIYKNLLKPVYRFVADKCFENDFLIEMHNLILSRLATVNK